MESFDFALRRAQDKFHGLHGFNIPHAKATRRQEGVKSEKDAKGMKGAVEFIFDAINTIYRMGRNNQYPKRAAKGNG